MYRLSKVFTAFLIMLIIGNKVEAVEYAKLDFGVTLFVYDYMNVSIVDNKEIGKWTLSDGYDVREMLDEIQSYFYFKACHGYIIDNRDYDKYMSFDVGTGTQFIITDTGICYLSDFYGERNRNPRLQIILSEVEEKEEWKKYFDIAVKKYKFNNQIFDSEDSNSLMTRGEYASVIVYYLNRLIDWDSRLTSYESPPFEFNKKHSLDLISCFADGILQGFHYISSEDMMYMGGESLINNEQQYVMLSRFLKSFVDYIKWDEEFHDSNLPNDFNIISDWAREDIEYLLKRDLIKLDENGNLNPLNNVTQEEAIKSSKMVFDYINQVIHSDMFLTDFAATYAEYEIYNWAEYVDAYKSGKVPVLTVTGTQ